MIGLDQILLQEFLADLFFRAAPEKHAVGHDRRHHAAGFADCQHVLGEHEVRLFARCRAPSPAIPLREFHVVPCVVLAEGRIGDHPVKTLKFAAFPVQGMQQGIFKPNVSAPDAMQEHVDFADGPGRGIIDLAAEAQIGRIAAGLLDILAADDQHAAGTTGGIVDTHSRRGIQMRGPSGGSHPGVYRSRHLSCQPIPQTC